MLYVKYCLARDAYIIYLSFQEPRTLWCHSSLWQDEEEVENTELIIKSSA